MGALSLVLQKTRSVSHEVRVIKMVNIVVYICQALGNELKHLHGLNNYILILIIMLCVR